ncbi:cyclic nucleotide-binding domain-containing protein [uncultured Tateyamaria sp.]|uniref:cyclic nucleotide-binding domain-containing protein n=1 Tax=uncultured Tateyamaria sp. TaxID=455651 RepID=UPI002620A81E|nr:cyclic nucleotide-binding domain-containing protein [uncultured Tateyamaria sp.]
MIDPYQIAGYFGVAFYLGSYALLQLGLLKGSSYTYALMNLTAASLVLVSLATGWNLFSAIIQISWITLSMVGMVRVWILTSGLRFTDEEQALIDAHFPTIRRIDARTLMRAGVWQDLEPGAPLTVQGEPVQQLSYIAQGGVDIDLGGQFIADVGAGGLIGEMGCMQSAPASASVSTNRPSRIFVLRSDVLRRLVKRNPDLGAHLEFAFAGNTRAKLMATNARLEEQLKARNLVAAAP